MKINVLTIFPELFDSFLKAPVVARCIENDICEIGITDIKEYAKGSFRHIDDSPYGGGAGMVMKCQPVLDALHAVRTPESHVIALSPWGKTYCQKDAHALCEKKHIILIAGHYEGMDARIYDECDELVSVGDYILTGGEIPCMTIIDSVTRLMEGALRRESTADESFEDGLLEYPQYTRPYDYEGRKVPDVLLSGNHEEIRKWRLYQSLKLTKEKRPDLLQERECSEEETKMLEELENI